MVLPIEETDEEDTDFKAETPRAESGSDSKSEHSEGLHQEVSSPIYCHVSLTSSNDLGCRHSPTQDKTRVPCEEEEERCVHEC